MYAIASAFAKKIVKATSFWQENRLILVEFRNFKRTAILAVSFAITAAVFEGVTVGLVTAFLQGLTNPDNPPIQSGIAWIDRTLFATSASSEFRIYRISAFLLVCVWCRASFDYVSNLYSKEAALTLLDCLRIKIFDQLRSLSLSFYAQTNPGALVNTLSSEVIQVKQAAEALSMMIVSSSKLIAYLVAMLMISWQLCLVSIFMLSLLALCLKPLIHRVKSASFQVPRANKVFISSLLSFISGIRTIHASNTQDYEQQRYRKLTWQVHKSHLDVIRLSALVGPIVEGAGATLLVGLVCISYRLLIISGQLTAAELLTFLFILIRVTPLFSSLNRTLVQFNSIQGSIHTVKELLKKEDKPYFQNGYKTFEGLQRSIDFDFVSFSYPGDVPVLKDIALSIERGKTTALVGASGSGKTTLADLLSRFYDPSEGRVMIDGVDLRSLDIYSLRARMAIVSQETFIFNTTVRRNIMYGIDENGSQASQEKVLEAARMANAMDFIEELPDKFETVLGDRGVRLSGGQRQRIAIARALLRDPEILILDEATSALDSVTEKLIQDSIEQLSKGRTVVVIAHRLSTIAKVDKVVVLEKGRIVEQGSYQSLIDSKGMLWNYHQMQFS